METRTSKLHFHKTLLFCCPNKCNNCSCKGFSVCYDYAFAYVFITAHDNTPGQRRAKNKNNWQLNSIHFSSFASHVFMSI